MKSFDQKGIICADCRMEIPRDPGGIEMDDERKVCRSCFQTAFSQVAEGRKKHRKGNSYKPSFAV